MLRLDVRLLGAVEVIQDGRRLRSFNSLRLQRFLALIALREDAQLRSRLAFELWPDSDESQARTNLRKLLHEFRHAITDLAEFVEIDNEVVRWKRNGPGRIDVHRFREAIAAGNLELAARVYSGDLLPACYDDWILVERERLRSEAHAALLKLAERAATSADHETATRHARRVIELEPTDEAAVRLLMEAQLAQGDRAGALRAYHRFAEVLDRELGVSPNMELRELYERQRIAKRDTSDLQKPAPGTINESPFVAREIEWQQLVDAWTDAPRTGAHLLLVAGEPGIGKSRLALELGRHVRSQGHMVVSARAYEAAGRLPWGPIVDLLRSDAFKAPIASLQSAWRAEIARLLPELGDRAQPIETDGPRDPARRHRLFDAVNRVLADGDRPRLLIIDDLQWCDAETIEMIGYVIRAAASKPVLIVGTVRSEEVPKNHPLVGLVDALNRELAITTINLERFDEVGVATLAAGMRAEESIDAALAARLWTETEGNPLFVIEALRAGITTKSSQSVLTPTMRAVLGSRLDQLGDGARRLTEVAAVIGRPFSVGLIGRATGSGEQDLVDDLDEMWRRRIVRDQGHTYDFSHDKLRAVALEMISPARKRQLHRKVADAIVAEAGDDAAAASPRVAAHYDQAGLVEPAIDAYRHAGVRALAVSAFDDAISAFRRALSLLAELPKSASRDALELDLRIALGSALVAVVGYGASDVHRLYERAMSLCRSLGRPVDPPILRGLGLARLQGCRFDDCSEMGKALLDINDDDPIARTEGRYLLGVSAFWRGEIGNCARYLSQAIDGYEPAHREVHLMRYAQDPKAICLVRLGLAELWTGDPDRASDSARSALEFAVDIDHLMTQVYVITYASILAAEAGDLQRLKELLAQDLKVRKRLSERYLTVILNALRGWLAVTEGSTEGMERIVDAAAHSRHEGETLHLTYTLLLLAKARGMFDEIAEGRAAAREALAWTDKYNQRYLEAELLRVDGELAYRAGDTDAAHDSLRKSVDVSSAQGANWLHMRTLHALASHFPEQSVNQQLAECLAEMASGQGLPAWQEAQAFLEQGTPGER